MIDNFVSLGIKQELSDLLRKYGITEPTPVQKKTIPEILTGRDVVVEAQTGTGKTLSFILPILQQINPNVDYIQGLIISPTRELALQITNEIKKLVDPFNINVLNIYGGQDVERQIRKLKGNIHIVVGTPGRLLDHINRKTVNFQRISMLVIDEADQMLHMGFLDDLNLVIKQTSSRRQTMLFSATIPKGIRSITLKHMKSPLTIRITGKSITLDEIDQVVIEIPKQLKLEVLLKLLDEYNPFMAIIFCLSKRRAQELNEELSRRGYSCDELHGDLSQNKRNSVMKKFRSAELQFLIATDIAGRGLDIEGITHVFNYDIPRDAETYIHRIGRTGRAGERGIAITLCEHDEKSYLALIEQSINKKLERKVAKVYEDFNDMGEIIKNIDIITIKEKDVSKQYNKQKISTGDDRKVLKTSSVGMSIRNRGRRRER